MEANDENRCKGFRSMDIEIKRDGEVGELLLTPKGVFSIEGALTITKIMAEMCSSHATILVDTNQITEVEPVSPQMLAIRFGELGLPRNKIFYKGEKGRDICHDQSQVRDFKEGEDRCCGRCEVCPRD